MNLPRGSETFETSKTPNEIRDLISTNALKYNPWSRSNDSEFYFSYKFDENMIYLNSHKWSYWPTVELELREFTKPTLRIHYAAFGVYRAFYILTFLVALTSNFQLKTANQIVGFLVTLAISIGIPLMAIYWQKNFKKWLKNLLRN